MEPRSNQIINRIFKTAQTYEFYFIQDNNLKCIPPCLHTHSEPGKIELAQRNTKAQVSRSQPEGGTLQFAYRRAVELRCYDSCLPLHLALMLSDKKAFIN